MRRRRIARWIAGLGAILSALLAVGYAAEKPAYLRINAPADTVIFIELRDNRLRLATSPGALASAQALRPRKLTRESATFSGLALPVSGKAIHPRCDSVKGEIEFFSFRGSTLAVVRMGVIIKDQANIPWTYWLSEVSGTAARPDQGKAVTLPQLSALKVTMTAQARGRQVMVAMVPKSGQTEVADIERAGKRVEAEVTIRDQGGKVVSSKRVALSELGFG